MSILQLDIMARAALKRAAEESGRPAEDIIVMNVRYNPQADGYRFIYMRLGTDQTLYYDADSATVESMDVEQYAKIKNELVNRLKETFFS